MEEIKKEDLVEEIDEIINTHVNCWGAKNCIDKALCQDRCNDKFSAAKEIALFILRDRKKNIYKLLLNYSKPKSVLLENEITEINQEIDKLKEQF